MSDVIAQKELLDKFGYSRAADLRRCLDAQKIPYHLGKGGTVVTTIQALNATLVGKVDNQALEIVAFD